MGALELRPGLTNRAVARALRSARFDGLAVDFDEVVYGGRAATSEDVGEARAEWPAVLAGARSVPDSDQAPQPVSAPGGGAPAGAGDASARTPRSVLVAGAVLAVAAVTPWFRRGAAGPTRPRRPTRPVRPVPGPTPSCCAASTTRWTGSVATSTAPASSRGPPW